MDYLGFMILFVVLWIIQFIFGLMQNQAMHKKLVEIKRNNQGNMLGIGLTRAKFNLGKGVIVIVVMDRDGIIVDFYAISGYTVAARFKQLKHFIGLQVNEIETQISNQRLLTTFRQAIAKINEEREKNGYLKIEFINK